MMGRYKWRKAVSRPLGGAALWRWAEKELPLKRVMFRDERKVWSVSNKEQNIEEYGTVKCYIYFLPKQSYSKDAYLIPASSSKSRIFGRCGLHLQVQMSLLVIWPSVNSQPSCLLPHPHPVVGHGQDNHTENSQLEGKE